jgi:hypothetical protein
MSATLKKLLEHLNIDETFTKRIQKPKEYTKIKDNVNLQEDYNMMADLLSLPTTRFGYKYLFVIVDLATREFDVEPMKTKDANVALNAMENCFKREYVRRPFASVTTDAGTEFKGVFHKWLFDKDIAQKTTLPGRHTQTSMIDSLCRQLGRLLNGYMNAIEVKTGKVSTNWLPILDSVREQLNIERKRKLPKNINSYEYPTFDPMKETHTKDSKTGKTKTDYEYVKPKFKRGQMVYRALNKPRNALGIEQPTTNFRAGDISFDTTAREIEQVLNYSGFEKYRYILDGLPNASYTERQLMKA